MRHGQQAGPGGVDLLPVHLGLVEHVVGPGRQARVNVDDQEVLAQGLGPVPAAAIVVLVAALVDVGVGADGDLDRGVELGHEVAKVREGRGGRRP